MLRFWYGEVKPVAYWNSSDKMNFVFGRETQKGRPTPWEKTGRKHWCYRRRGLQRLGYVTGKHFTRSARQEKMYRYMPSYYVSFFMDRDLIEVSKNEWRNRVKILPSWRDRLGQYRVYCFTNNYLKGIHFSGTKQWSNEAHGSVHQARSQSRPRNKTAYPSEGYSWSY